MTDQEATLQDVSYPLQQRTLAHIRPRAGAEDGGGQLGEQDGDEPAEDQPLKISDQDVDGYKEQDRFLPIANVGRVMKRVLPQSTKVSKDAKEVVQECTSEFISFITSEAAERCTAEKRKTINGEDILFAMNSLGFENYAEVMKIYLSKWRALASREGKRTRKRAASGGVGARATGNQAGKRARTEGGDSESTPRSEDQDEGGAEYDDDEDDGDEEGDEEEGDDQ